MNLSAHTTLLLDQMEIETGQVDVSIPDWHFLADPGRPSHRGVIHHEPEGIRDMVDAMYKHSLEEHLRFSFSGEFLRHHDCFVMSIEPFINIGVPVYRRASKPRLLCRAEEEYREVGAWPYMALIRAGGTLRISRVQFSGERTNPQVIVDGLGRKRADWGVVGIPILDNGKPLKTDCVAAFFYDPRHVWQLVFEEWQRKRWPKSVNRDRPVRERIMKSFMNNLTSPWDKRGQELGKIAGEAKLKLSKYFRLSLGMNAKNGRISIILGHDSIVEAAERQREQGADRAILLGHGGNAAIGYHSTRVQREGRCQGVSCFTSSTYGRETHAALVIPLRRGAEMVENVFIGES